MPDGTLAWVSTGRGRIPSARSPSGRGCVMGAMGLYSFPVGESSTWSGALALDYTRWIQFFHMHMHHRPATATRVWTCIPNRRGATPRSYQFHLGAGSVSSLRPGRLSDGLPRRLVRSGRNHCVIRKGVKGSRLVVPGMYHVSSMHMMSNRRGQHVCAIHAWVTTMLADRTPCNPWNF